MARRLGAAALLGAVALAAALLGFWHCPGPPWMEDALVVLYLTGALGAGIALATLLGPPPYPRAAPTLALNSAALALLALLPPAAC